MIYVHDLKWAPSNLLTSCSIYCKMSGFDCSVSVCWDTCGIVYMLAWRINTYTWKLNIYWVMRTNKHLWFACLCHPYLNYPCHWIDHMNILLNNVKIHLGMCLLSVLELITSYYCLLLLLQASSLIVDWSSEKDGWAGCCIFKKKNHHKKSDSPGSSSMSTNGHIRVSRSAIGNIPNT